MFDESGAVSDVSLISPQQRVQSGRRRRYALIPVKSDWTDPRGLMGYFNPLTGRYFRTPFLELILAARADLQHPYFAILDEMNLARVEYYLSDVLSAMESGEPIDLGVPDEGGSTEDAEDDSAVVPSSVAMPPNLLVIGTVNVDETTHAFSPKVLDRANVIEFNDVSVSAFLHEDEEIDEAGLRVRPDSITPRLLVPTAEDRKRAVDVAREHGDSTEALVMVHGILERFDRHFGYRVIEELLAFSGNTLTLVDDDADSTADTAFDLQLVQKVLPKLSGGRKLKRRSCIFFISAWRARSQERKISSTGNRREGEESPRSARPVDGTRRPRAGRKP